MKKNAFAGSGVLEAITARRAVQEAHDITMAEVARIKDDLVRLLARLKALEDRVAILERPGG